MRSQLQTLRSQVELYKLQHRDTAPTQANFWTVLTTKTDDTGAASTAADAFGPYMQDVAVNPLTNSSTVVDTGTTPAVTTGWYYDPTTHVVHGANKAGAQSDDGE
jgi:hypothetical protein